MKKYNRVVCVAMALVMALPAFGAHATTAVQVTEYPYTSLVSGAENGIAYTAYDENGALVMGTLSAEGEQSREPYSFSGWDALFATKEWEMTAVGDGTPLCPYASSHGDKTICPYKELAQVRVENTQTGVVIEDVFVPSGVAQELPSGQVHFCFGRYGYKDASTMRWDGESDYFALKNEQGLWGVYDGQNGTMLTDFLYADMSAVYGTYAKVFDGEKWARLDVSGAFATRFIYESAESFSVRDEVRAVADGEWRVFTKDNEPMSAIMVGDYTDVTYAPEACAVLAKASDGTTELIDLSGATIATFAADTKVRYLQDTCYAAEKYTENGALIGMALWRVDAPTRPGDLVVRGDVNFDGAIDSRDARLALCELLGTRPLTTLKCAAADMNGNGTVDSADVRDILRVSTNG